MAVFTAFAAAVVPAAAKSPYGRDGYLDRLISKADAIAAVEILSTDYTATAADGPMYAQAKVLKVVKGDILTGRRLLFGETGWWSPNYKRGEHRIVFLARVTSKNDYYKSTWHTIYSGGVDFFFGKDSLRAISPALLSDLLQRIIEADQFPPKVELDLAQTSGSIKVLTLKLINKAPRSFWVNPSRVVVSFEANRIRRYRRINWTGYRGDRWIEVKPDMSLEGSIYIRVEEVKGAEEIQFILSHLSARFPYRSWLGAESVRIALPD